MKLDQQLKTIKALSKLFSEGGSNAKHFVMDDANVCMGLSTNPELLKPFEDGEHNKLPPTDFLTGAVASRYSVKYLKKIISTIEASGAESVVLVMKQDYPLLVTTREAGTLERIGFILAPIAPRVESGTPANAKEIWQDWKALEKPAKKKGEKQ